jgi:SWI/SNF-related matrix-associated actin-dependent regulator 1 of chromatin subfamily A
MTKKTDKTEGTKTEKTNLTYNEERKRFEFKGSAQIKEIPKTAGFRWDNDKVVWHTADAKNAEKIKDWSDKATRELIEKRVEEHSKNIEDSWKQDSNKEFPSPMGLTYAGYQKAAIEFALKRKNILIADQMGLGKTIEAIGIINADESVKKVLIITPASLKYNWKKELLGDERKKGWLTRNMSVAIINPQEYSEGDIQIINYDILNRYKDKLKESNKRALIILDEAHYIKGHKAQRTKAAQELLKGAGKRILMTGTPIMNRPIELYPMLQSLEDPLADNWVHYVRRYCDAYKSQWGWMVKGASHLDELQDKLRSSVMIRRLKSDVLKELPPKRRQIIEIPADDELKQFVNQEKNIVNQTVAETQDLVNEIQSMRDNKIKSEEYTQKVEQLREAKQYEFSELEKIRHQTALAKTKKILGDLDDLLETDEKFIIFAHHKDVIDMIYQHFKDKAVKLTGSDSAQKKQEAVEKFQNDEKIKIFVGNIQAAGVGITLTASSTVIFIELDWSPSNMTQAEDRSNRIGQQKPVNVIHYVVDGSIDSMLAKKLVDKQDIIDKALDKSAEMEAAKKEIDILDTILG